MTTSLSLCVLGSGSGGNCSALVLHGSATRRVVLIDIGLTPRQTRLRLARVGLDLSDVTDALLTHLDTDHFCPTWRNLLPSNVTLHIHHRHMRRAERDGCLYHETLPFDDDFDLHGCAVSPFVVSHDRLGAVAFRFQAKDGTLGFITDCGNVSDAMIDHFRSIDILAIESNYDAQMEAQSGRPAFLIQRITGGSGHLSNEQARDAVRRIAPTREVVLLHLSRQCNHPAYVEPLYQDDGLVGRLVLSNQREPARWVHLDPAAAKRDGSLLEPHMYS
ncbi:MAG: MBL fold metallo-hydrolase [Phycisphaerales bacterium]|nr:MBL fold metallo-hydrolase [Phycisphaerales bacterium]